jgi:microcin C transport system substrate-binding protein
MQALVFAAACLIAVAPVFAAESFPPPDWKERPDPIADERATPGGALSTYVGQYPESFNYYLANNTFCASLFGLLFDTLLGIDPLTAEYRPSLARSWRISDDKRTFTFTLDERARWSDGAPITAEDVRWTFDAIMAPTNLTGPHKVSLERFAPPTVIDPHTIRFTAGEVHWQNLAAAGGFHILPRHVFAKRPFNEINFAFPVVAGPYRLDTIKEGISARLVRRPDWWQQNRPSTRNTFNFESIVFRFYGQPDNAFEALKKGSIDLFSVHTSRLWVKETQSHRFVRNWIVRQRVQNYAPVGFQGFALNMRRAPYNDPRVRKALAHLLDREKMNRQIMFNQYFMHRSYFEDLYTPQTPCTNELIGYDRDAAIALLQAAGWKANPASGFLEKDGQRFTLNFLTRSPDTDQFLQIYNEDLKAVGIELKIDRKDWAAWSKDMDAYNYDVTWAAWSAGLFRNPQSMWASAEADRKGGNNITGFKDPAVDALIEKQKTIFDIQARNAILRELDARVTAQCPYVLLWNLNYARLLYWNKFGTPPTVLSKYGDSDSALQYWWFDEDSAAELQDAMAHDAQLPPRPASIVFDDAFRPPQ